MARKTWVTLVGWVLVALGCAALILPGPGLLMLVAGLVVLSQEYEWAERRVEPMKRRAFDVAKQGVSSWPRIALSLLAAVAVMAVGVVWGLDPKIPTVWILGPRLPVGGGATGSSILISGIIAVGLLVYSIKRWRAEAVAEHRQRRSVRAEADRSGGQGGRPNDPSRPRSATRSS